MEKDLKRRIIHEIPQRNLKFGLDLGKEWNISISTAGAAAAAEADEDRETLLIAGNPHQ